MSVLALQATEPRRFGELACELGYMDESALDELLQLQLKSRPKLGEVVVEFEWLTEAQIVEELADYNRSEA